MDAVDIKELQGPTVADVAPGHVHGGPEPSGCLVYVGLCHMDEPGKVTVS